MRPFAPDQLEGLGVTYRDLFEALQEGIWVIDQDAKTTFVNKPMADMLGYTAAEMLHRPLFDFMDARGRELCDRNLARRQQGIEEQHEFEFLRRDGRRVYTLIATSPLKRGHGAYAGAVAGVLDITDRKAAEENLEQRHEALQGLVDQRTEDLQHLNRELARQVEESAAEIAVRKELAAQLKQERLRYEDRLRALIFATAHTEQIERRRIAGALHDDIGQILLLSKLKLGDLISSEKPEDVLAASEEIKDLLDRCITATRALTTEISPPLLFDLGFEAAAESLGRHLARKHAIGFRYITDHEPKPISADLQSLLYQCVRELFRNIVQHAGARRMELAVLRDRGWVTVRVGDNGKGMEELPELNAADNPSRIGLFDIRERIRYIGGTFEIDAAPGRGTQVRLAVPFTRALPEDGG